VPGYETQVPMPFFGLDDADVDALVDFLLSR
jgi:hypothetical protein